jgi:hypothetical protein
VVTLAYPFTSASSFDQIISDGTYIFTGVALSNGQSF